MTTHDKLVDDLVTLIRVTCAVVVGWAAVDAFGVLRGFGVLCAVLLLVRRRPTERH